MSYLKDFASFIKNNKLDDFVSNELKTIYAFNVPLMKYISELGETELKASVKKSAYNFLSGLEKGNAKNIAGASLEKWENDELPFPKDAVSLADIVLIYTAQKITLLSFLPQYNAASKEAVDIMLEVENYYKDVQEMAMHTLLKIENEKQQRLKESEERFRDLFDNANDLIHIVTPEGHILHVNNAWMQTLGYTSEELIGKSIYSFITDNERQHFQKFREGIIAGDPDLKMIETSLRSKQGKEVIVEGMISCKYKDGMPLYTRGILRNITRRIENEKQLKFFTRQLVEREESMKHLIKNAPDAIVVINEESRIQLWNPKSEEIFGWKETEVINALLTDTIIPHQYREAHLNGMQRLLKTDEVNVLNKTIHITALKKGGEEFFISLTISRSVQNNKSVFIAFIRDISEEKKTEKETEEQRKQLEKTNEELEHYAKLTSHDLKEPLRKILINSDIILKKHSAELNPAVKNKLEKINSSASRMNRLIEDVLHYTEILNKKDLFTDVKLNEVLKEVLADLENSIEEKHASVLIGDLPEIKAIPLQMHQLFQNLISNALKYSRADVKPLIEIRAESLNNDYTEISIKDNGIGIEEEYNETIFRVYERLHSKNEFEGSGIGLALCKKITEMHGGSIQVQSQKGVGSTFIIKLPLKKE